MAEQLRKLQTHGLDNAEIQAFLIEHPFLAPFLAACEQYVLDLFGFDTEIVYKLIKDHEIPSEIQLFGFIWTEIDVDEALEKFSAFDYDWYLQQDAALRKVINFQIRLGKLDEL